MELERAFGIVLKSYRKKAGLSQESLAFDCGLDRTYISLLERGQRSPTLKSIFLVFNSLDVKPSHVIREVERVVDEDN